MRYLHIIVIIILVSACSKPSHEDKLDHIISQDTQTVRGSDNAPTRLQSADYNGQFKGETGADLQEPEFKVLGRGPVLPKHNLSLPVSSINITELELELFYVANPGKYLSAHQHYIDSSIDSWDLNYAGSELSSVYFERYRVNDVEANKDVKSRIALPKNLKEGWYFARMRIVGDVNDYSVFPIHITSLGSHLNYFPGSHSAELYVNELKTGKPIDSGYVRAYKNGKIIGSKYPIVKGKAEVKEFNGNTLVIHGSDGSQINIISPREVPLDLSEFDIAGPDYKPLETFIYANRDLVKPSESILLSLLIRNEDGEKTNSVPVHLKIIKPDGQKDKVVIKPASITGFYQYKLSIPREAPTGLYKVESRINPHAKNPDNVFQFQVQEFTPEKMALLATLQSEVSKLSTVNNLSLKGRYLFGAPANGNIAQVSITSRPIRYIRSQSKKFYVGESFTLHDKYKQLPNIKLDIKGEANIALPKLQNDIISPVESTVTIVLRDEGATGAQKKVKYITVGKNKFVGVKELAEQPSYYSDVDFELAILSGRGDVTEKGNITASLYRNTGSYFWSYSELSGWKRHNKSDPWELVSAKSVDLKKGIGSIQLPVKWGQYRLIADSPGAQKVDYKFNAGWGSGGLSALRPGMLDIELNKDQFNAGDIAEVSFTPTVTGKAIVNLVSDEVLWSRTVSTRRGGKQTLKIPVKWKRHDLYFSIINVGIDEEDNPGRTIGIRHLKLNRLDRALHVDVTLPKKLIPNENVTLPISISSKNGRHKNARFTVSLVDKGITNITDYHGKNPYDYFYAQRRYPFDHVDLYGRIFSQTNDPFANPKFGGDTPGGKNNTAEELVESKTIILNSKVIQTNGDGQAEVSFNIPDYNGEAQLVVTAFNTASFGVLERDITIADDYIAELSVPTFLVPGDKTAVFATVHNLSGVKSSLEVTLKHSPLSGVGNSTERKQSISLDDNEKWSDRISFEISDNTLSKRASFSIVVKTPSGRVIEREWSTPIRHAEPIKSQGASFVLQAGEIYQVDPLLFESLKASSASVRVSTMPNLPISTISKDLFSYPYGCGEQTTSKAFAWLLKSDQLKNEKDKFLSKGHSEEEILAAAITKIKTFKKMNGSFGLWSSRSRENRWLTVYMTDFLIQANIQYGDTLIAKKDIETSIKRIKEYVVTSTSAATQSSLKSFSYRSYAAYVLAKTGNITRADLKKLESQYIPAYSNNNTLAQVYIAGAYAWLGDITKAKSLLEIKQLHRSNDYFADYGSSIRDMSLIINVLDELEEEKLTGSLDLRTEFYAQLVKENKARRYLSTQERIALIKASLGNKTKPGAFNYVIDGELKSTYSAKNNPVIKNSTLKNANDFPLYIDVNVFGLPDKKVTEFNGIKAQHRRSLYNPDGSKFTENIINVGQRIVVVNEIIYQESIFDVMGVDFIPGGFILENPDLNQSIDTSQIQYKNHGNTVVGLTRTFNMTEYRNDRYVMSHDLLLNSYQNEKSIVYSYVIRAEAPGVYQLPPSYLEDMYQPYRFFISYGDLKSITIE